MYEAHIPQVGTVCNQKSNVINFEVKGQEYKVPITSILCVTIKRFKIMLPIIQTKRELYYI